MLKNNTHIFFVEQEDEINVLLFGFSGILKDNFINYLNRYGCHVITDINEAKNLNLSYIFHQDNLSEISKTLYLTSKNNAKLIFLDMSENPKSYAKAQKLISQIKAGVEIYFFNFSKPNNQKETVIIIEQIFQKIFLGKKHLAKIETETKDINKIKNKIKKPFIVKFNFLTILFSLLLLIIFLSGITIGSFYYGTQKLKQTVKEFKAGNLVSAKISAGQANVFLSLSEKSSKFFLPAIKLISYDQGKSIEDTLRVANLFSKTCSQAIYIVKLSQTIAESIISSRTSLHTSQLDTLQVEVKSLNTNVAELIAYLRSIEAKPTSVITRLNIFSELKQGEEMLASVSQILELSERFTTILPEVLGYEKPKTFLMLFQNNAELRPTGGFIGSFGWVTFSKGRLIEFKTEDVYTADGQLKGYVEPPPAIKKYLASENWYLRDSNFDPDFALSAEQAEWFLKHEMNLVFDGVFALDLNSVQEILKALGGVYLSDYKQEITADNLFLKTQETVEKGFFPGSSQKRDFLGSLGRGIFIKLTSGNVSWADLLKGVKNSLDQKHILAYFHNDKAQQLVEKAGWGGRVASLSCSKANCLFDYLMLVEANLGINKANFLIEREAKLNISQEPGGLTHQLIISYNNESPGSVYPIGEYFSYTRIILPKDVTIKELKLSGEKIAQEDITIERYQDKTLIGFPMRIPNSSKKDLQLTYSIPKTSQSANLELLVQKQPGIKAYPLEISIATPENPSKSYSIIGDQLISLPL